MISFCNFNNKTTSYAQISVIFSSTEHKMIMETLLRESLVFILSSVRLVDVQRTRVAKLV